MSTAEIEARFAREADIHCPDRYNFIPCFDDFLLRTTNFIVSTQTPPARVLILGAQFPVLAPLYREYFPNARYVLVDREENLATAREWFAASGNIELVVCDYPREFPEGDFDLALSALSVHRLSDRAKQELFCEICAALPEGGVLVNYDRFRAAYGLMDAWQSGYREAKLLESGLSAEQIRRWRLDAANECTVAAEMDMLRQAGFQAVSNVYTNLKFSVLTGVR